MNQDPSFPQVVREELSLLDSNRQRLLENPEKPGASELEVVQQLLMLRDEMRESTKDDRAACAQQMEHLEALLDQIRRGKRHGTVDPDTPYFGHLRVEEGTSKRDVFLGRATRLGAGLRIVDWRNAPISRLFYQYKEGEEYEEELGGEVRSGRVNARRTVHIQGGKLLRVGAPTATWVRETDGWSKVNTEQTRLAGGQGAALRSGNAVSAHLGTATQLRANKHLPDIAALIDEDQFELITQPGSGVVVLRGSAGSGKTTVALHRIAFLAYNWKPRFPADRVLVIVWGRAMKDYVAHVLPALGVEGVQVTTWSSWARKLTKRHFPDLPRHVSEDTPEPVTRIKLHPGVAELLEARQKSHAARPNIESALFDWAEVLTDSNAIAEAMGDDITPGALKRGMKWMIDQTSAVLAWAEGDREADARLDPEDDALLLRAYQLRVGPLRKRRSLALQHVHLVLDEVQDFSPVEVQVLLGTCTKERSVTLAGDTRQHISKAAGFSNWHDFLGRIGVKSTALNTLQVSYRSTHPITRFAIKVLDDDREPAPQTNRDGPPVELFSFSEHGACVAFLSEELKRLRDAEPLANIALLTPDAATSSMYADGLARADLPEVRQVINQEFAFSPGIDVVEADQVKGLEFDYVVIVEASAHHWPDTPHHRRLMHVAATRAVHQLWLTSVGTPSPILPKNES